MKIETIDFFSNNDVELNKGSTPRNCSYRIFNAKSKKGILVFIPGFGADLSEYAYALCEKIAKNYDIATLCVEYFAYSSRPSSGATVGFSAADLAKIDDLLASSGLKKQNDLQRNLDALDRLAKKNKTKFLITGDLKPKHGEYQNFGLLPALDILNGIRDAVARFDLDANNITLMGSSYGGYLANMVTKIAPGYIRLVLDNSSWAMPNFNYFLGKELNRPEFSSLIRPNIGINLWALSPWTLRPGLSNTFSEHHHQIRSFNSSQLKQMMSQGGVETSYVFYHSLNDTGIAPVQQKIEMVQNMISLGCKNVQMEVMTDENDVDGVFIKNLDHGMGMSLYSFFEKYYMDKIAHTKGFIETCPAISKYQCHDRQYLFNFSTMPLSFTLEHHVG